MSICFIRRWWEGTSPRERDVAVAEKIMGWTWECNSSQDLLFSPDGEGTIGAVRFHNKKNGLEALSVTSYTSRIPAAIEVLDMMNERGYRYRIEISDDSWNDGWQRVWLNKEGGAMWDAEVGGPIETSLPKAICLAALIAVENDTH